MEKGPIRSEQQITSLITRRQEYVQKNIETIQKQNHAVEQRLEELETTETSETPRAGGLPLTEIHEELDEEGNVVSSTLSQPEQATSNIVESLRKAGLTDIASPPDEDAPGSEQDHHINDVRALTESDAINEEAVDDSTDVGATKNDVNLEVLADLPTGPPRRPAVRKKSVSFTADAKPPQEPSRSESQDGRKSVSFAPKVAIAPAAPEPDPRTVSFSPTIEEIPPEPERSVSFSTDVQEIPAEPERTVSFAPKIQEIPPETKPARISSLNGTSEASQGLHASFKAGDKVVELNEDDKVANRHIIIPENESPEDARIRREMLEYSLNDIGAVVAELDLEEGDEDYSSEYTGSEYMDEDTPYTSGLSDDEEEDEFGRSTKRVLSDDYIKQMKDLEQRLIGNLGNDPKDEDLKEMDPELVPSDVKRLVIREKSSSISSGSDAEKRAGGKKRVSFAEELDIASPSSPPMKAQKLDETAVSLPMAEGVVERSAQVESAAPDVAQTGKASRFKKTRAIPVPNIASEQVSAANQAFSTARDTAIDTDDTPHGPPGMTLAQSVLERAASSTSAVPPSEDNLDPEIQQRELAGEYYRLRNEMIRNQGGFRKVDSVDEEGNEIGELMEERDGKVKKVSRFKAARLNG